MINDCGLSPTVASATPKLRNCVDQLFVRTVVQLRYRFRVYPTHGQVRSLARAFGCSRVVFNDAVAARRDAYKNGLPYPTSTELSRQLTAAKKTPERAFLAEVSAVVLQQALSDCETAYRNFFKSLKGSRKGAKVGPPKFKKRSSRQSIRFTKTSKFRILDNGRLRLTKIGDLEVRWSRQLPADPSSVTVIKDSACRYFVSFVVHTELEPLSRCNPNMDTGIDLGLSRFAVLRDRVIATPKFFRQAERKIKKAQREFNRKVKGSNNRRKACLKLAKVHAHVADRRKDFIEQETTRIVRENQACYVEELSVRGMTAKRGGLGKSAWDQALGAFVRTLEYKCHRYGRHFVKVNRWFPSTQLCSACESLDGPKGRPGLKVRTWRCSCGVLHDRDANAELNLRVEGRRVLARKLAAGHQWAAEATSAVAERVNACGAQVRPGKTLAQRDESGTRQKPNHTVVRQAGNSVS